MHESPEFERQVAAGTVKLVGTSRDEIVRQCERLLTDSDAYLAMSRAHNPYGDGQAVARIVKTLQSLQS